MDNERKTSSKYTIKNFLSRSPQNLNDVNVDVSKRQLSSGSSEVSNVTKKAKESADDVFSDAPAWAVALFNSMEKVNTKIDNLSATTQDLLDFKIATESKVEALEDMLKAISVAIDVNAEEHESFSGRIKTLEKKVAHLEKEHKRVESELDANQMYSRRNNLIIHGIAETRDENTDAVEINFLKSELNLSLTERDLDRSHRLGKRDESKKRPRPIIIKFLRHNDKHLIYSKKKLLKNKPFLITESLTPNRLALYKAAREKYGNSNVWTNDGRIKFKSDGKVNVIS